MRLQREKNVEADARATLLIEHWDRVDWSQLWWVRAELERTTAFAVQTAELSELLARRYAQYREQPFERILVFRVVGITGWAGISD